MNGILPIETLGAMPDTIVSEVKRMGNNLARQTAGEEGKVITLIQITQGKSHKINDIKPIAENVWWGPVENSLINPVPYQAQKV